MFLTDLKVFVFDKNKLQNIIERKKLPKQYFFLNKTGKKKKVFKQYVVQIKANIKRNLSTKSKQ